MSTVAEDIKKLQDTANLLPPDEVIGDLKHVVVKEGKEREFESLFRELAAKAKAHDKGVHYYDLYRSAQPRAYVVMAQYENRDALQRHQKSEHGKHYFPKIRELLEKIEVSYHLCSVQLKSL
ncbi:putative quinol monooxygenase [Candidatus Nitrososphaera sp. FF02]|uniref:putative quinol monooxygenase n=1 Tax=Candidatus Nitrososphaera sp. FF02 TaxID=3398226 RepID=UPI0039ECFED4